MVKHVTFNHRVAGSIPARRTTKEHTMKLVVGKEIPRPEVVKDKFCFHVRFMHGDADHYDEESWPCRDALEASFYYETYSLGIGLGSVGKFVDDIPSEEIMELAVKYREMGCDFLQKEDFDDLVKWVWDEVPGDSTTDHQFKAAIDRVWITYFDKDGREFEVEVKE